MRKARKAFGMDHREQTAGLSFYIFEQVPRANKFKEQVPHPPQHPTGSMNPRAPGALATIIVNTSLTLRLSLDSTGSHWTGCCRPRRWLPRSWRRPTWRS